MASAKPLVKRNVGFPIITLEVAMMQLMKKRGSNKFNVFFDDHFFEPGMTLCWCQGSVLRIKQHMDRVGRHYPMNQDAAEVKNMLNGVHS